MEVEHFAGAGFGVAAVGKPGNDACAFVQKGQWLLVVDPFQLGTGIACGLVFYLGDFVAVIFFFGFNHANGFFVHKQHVVGRPNVGLVFTHRKALPGTEIDFFGRLNHPACQLELRIDVVACLLFRCLVFGHDWAKFGR